MLTAMVFHIALLVGGLVPLAGMIAALFAASWLREGRRADERAAAHVER